MNGQQLDFASLGIPPLESDALVFPDATDHPALSRRSSSEKSIDCIDKIELSSEDDIDSYNLQAQDVLDQLCRFFPQIKSQDGERQSDGERPCAVRQTLQMSVKGGNQQPIGSNLPPPRRFYRRFWFGISKRLMKRESAFLNKSE